jgi:hypothetical protein
MTAHTPLIFLGYFGGLGADRLVGSVTAAKTASFVGLHGFAAFRAFIQRLRA